MQNRRRLGQRLSEAARRLHIIRSLAHVSEVDFLIISALAITPGPWRAMALADYTNIPRPTIIRRLKRLRDAGKICRTEDGWMVTPEVHDCAKDFIEQCSMLVHGVRTGIDHHVFEKLSNGFASAVPDSRLLALAFPPLPELVSTMDTLPG